MPRYRALGPSCWRAWRRISTARNAGRLWTPPFLIVRAASPRRAPDHRTPLKVEAGGSECQPPHTTGRPRWDTRPVLRGAELAHGSSRTLQRGRHEKTTPSNKVRQRNEETSISPAAKKSRGGAGGELVGIKETNQHESIARGISRDPSDAWSRDALWASRAWLGCGVREVRGKVKRKVPTWLGRAGRA